MTPWQARLAVLAVFLAGAVAGGAAVHGYHMWKLGRLLTSDTPIATLIAHDLAGRLSLSAAQRKEVERIVQRARAEVIATLQPVGPRLVETFQRAVDEIRAHLDEPQRQRLDALLPRQLLRSLSDGGEPNPPPAPPHP